MISYYDLFSKSVTLLLKVTMLFCNGEQGMVRIGQRKPSTALYLNTEAMAEAADTRASRECALDTATRSLAEPLATVG